MDIRKLSINQYIHTYTHIYIYAYIYTNSKSFCKNTIFFNEYFRIDISYYEKKKLRKKIFLIHIQQPATDQQEVITF